MLETEGGNAKNGIDGLKYTLKERQMVPMCAMFVCSVAQSCLTLPSLMECALQAPPSMGFSRQEHWSGLPFPFPENLLDPGIEPMSPVSPPLKGKFFTTEPPGKPRKYP